MKPDKGSLDSYWKLRNYRNVGVADLKERLRGAGYRVKSGTLKEEIIHLAQRIDRGLLCYDACTKGELEGFVDARSLTCCSEGRDALSRTLVQEDDSPKFRHFVDLAPELRSRIYSYYIAQFPEMLLTPAQPPLSKICKLIRNEVLPVFYGGHTFVLKFDHIAYLVRPTMIRATRDTYCFVEALTKASTAEIRNVQMCFGRVGSYHMADCRINIRLGSFTATVHVSPAANTDSSYYKQWIAKQKETDTKMQEVLRSMPVRDGKMRFTVEKIYALRRVLTEVFFT